MKHFLAVAGVLGLLLSGCGSVEYDPVTSAEASLIKSSSKLDDAVAALGDYHTPSSSQLAALQATIDRMPNPIRKNAETDRKVAWGNDSNFLIVLVNDKGEIWATANRHSGGN